MSTEWSKTTKYIVGIGLTIFGIYILYLSRPILTLIVIAALVAFLLMPIVDFFDQRFRIPRGLAVLLSYFILIVVLALAPLVFIPPIINGFNYLVNLDYQILVDNTVDWTQQTLLNLKQLEPHTFGIKLDLDPLIDPALKLVQNTEANFSVSFPSVETMLNSLRSAVTITYGVATNVVGTVFAGTITFIVTLLSAIYFSLDGHKFVRWFLNGVPPTYRPEIARLLKRLFKTWRAYFRGQLNLMIIIGVVTWIGNTAIGLPGALALAVIAGFLELIPNLGPFLAAIPAVIVALIQGSTYLGVNNFVFALIVIGLYILIQQLENALIVPRILGEAVDLHPLVVMMGVVVGASAGGILGALLAAPIIASAREILNYLYAKMLGKDPYPSEREISEVIKPPWLSYSQRMLIIAKTWIASRIPRPAVFHRPKVPTDPTSDSNAPASERQNKPESAN